jgi:hypothetical protein
MSAAALFATAVGLGGLQFASGLTEGSSTKDYRDDPRFQFKKGKTPTPTPSGPRPHSRGETPTPSGPRPHSRGESPTTTPTSGGSGPRPQPTPSGPSSDHQHMSEEAPSRQNMQQSGKRSATALPRGDTEGGVHIGAIAPAEQGGRRPQGISLSVGEKLKDLEYKAQEEKIMREATGRGPKAVMTKITESFKIPTSKETTDYVKLVQLSRASYLKELNKYNVY